MNCVALHAGNPGPITGAGNWTYLVPGDRALLIDAGVGQPAHLDAVFARVPAGPVLVAVTHIHSDHSSGAPALRARAPGAVFSKYPWPGRDAAVDVPWQPLSDGQTVDTGEGPLQVVHTPGHSPDHVVFWHEASRTAFTGDLLVLGSTVVIPASHGGVLVDYLHSLERLAALGPVRAYPAHGPVIDDPLALIARYVAHRAERERQVLDALAEGATPIAGLVARIYDRLDPALLPMAHESVLAQLHKLAAEGRAASDGGTWALVG
jgi:glyoxylase-like metal-dependent hydrolase (beta-lactamase superfamily II)